VMYFHPGTSDSVAVGSSASHWLLLGCIWPKLL